MKNVLVFPCGTEIGLEINAALRFIKFINWASIKLPTTSTN